MLKEKELAKILMDGVWDQNASKVSFALEEGADPNWIVNGYPILLHAVFVRNEEILELLIGSGASQLDIALGFALDRGIGEMIVPLAYRGAIPKEYETKKYFGPYPKRYTAPVQM